MDRWCNLDTFNVRARAENHNNKTIWRDGQTEQKKKLTVSSKELFAMSMLVSFLLAVPLRSVGQSGAPPTIWPWIAVPRTVPKTSTVIPEKHMTTDQQREQHHKKGLLWSAAHTVCSGRVSLLLVLADEHGESWVWNVKALRKRKHNVRAEDAQSRRVPDAALWDTNRLHWLEEAVKHQVPEDVPLSKRRNVPDKEVGQHSKRCWEDNPVKKKDGILY